MTLLLCNDDGVYAPGLVALEQELRGLGDVRVVAPNQDRSGVSNSLTLHRPVHAEHLPNGFIAVDGTPTDCVHLGTAELFMPVPERVISGINLGPNMGDDVLYSGTLAAAMEGRFLAKPSLAVSLDAGGAVDVARFAVAAGITRYLIEVVDSIQLPPRTVFNVNIPDLPVADIRGIQLTFLGQRLRGENPISTENPRGKTSYWIGRSGGPVDYVEGNDFHALANGYISITPLHADMTCRTTMPILEPVIAEASARLLDQVGTTEAHS